MTREKTVEIISTALTKEKPIQSPSMPPRLAKRVVTDISWQFRRASNKRSEAGINMKI